MTTPAQYEFTDDQNVVIRTLGKHMSDLGGFLQLLGVLYVVLGVLQLVGGFMEPAASRAASLGYAISALVYFVIGRWTRTAGVSVTNVATTTGNDLQHLMTALDQLRKLYGTMVTLIKVVFVLMILGFVIAVLLPRFA